MRIEWTNCKECNTFTNIRLKTLNSHETLHIYRRLYKNKHTFYFNKRYCLGGERMICWACHLNNKQPLFKYLENRKTGRWAKKPVFRKSLTQEQIMKWCENVKEDIDRYMPTVMADIYQEDFENELPLILGMNRIKGIDIIQEL